MNRTDELHLDELRVYLQAEDCSPVTINGYMENVRVFTRWFENQNEEELAP